MDFNSPVALRYHTYNSLFLSLPFQAIEQTGTQLALFAQACKDGMEFGRSPQDIIDGFWQMHIKPTDETERLDKLFQFIQYLERQVVLFDSVEDALFEEMHDLGGAGSVNHLLLRLNGEQDRLKLSDKLRTFQLRLVLTAHPTQFYPGKVLGIINDLGKEIRHNNLAQIRLLLMQLGKTSFLNRQRPTPLDEAVSLGWYLENIFYETMPDIVFRLLRALGQDVVAFENPHLLALGFWPGGDRDGNPFVTAETTLAVATRMRHAILRRYYYDIRQLRRRLTFRGVEDCIASAEQKINNTLYAPQEASYADAQDLLNDLLDARRILVEEHDSLFLDALDRFILNVRIFGFFFASIDIRQDSRKHTEVWNAVMHNWGEHFHGLSLEEFRRADEMMQANRLLTIDFELDENDYADPFVKETIRSFRLIHDIQKANGERGCHRYIISNCQSALHVAEALALARLTTPREPSVATDAPESELIVPVDIVPLFETVEDLAGAGAVMERLYANEYYARHLAGRGNRQTIMLGFSDGTKDGGYLRANWSIYRAKEALTSVSRQYGVEVIFFDGRGGPPGRGGGNNANYYAAQGDEIENREIHVTIQGQTVSSTYGTAPAARFNIERLLTAGLENHLFGTHARELSEQDRLLMDDLAEAAYKAYLDLKNHSAFVPYLEQITPLKWYGETNIASRPAKRGGASKLRFEDLRAIPFVGAWSQMKQNVPGYYGVGAALAALEQKHRRPELIQLYQRSLFFRTLMENSMQSISKSNFNATRYLADNPKFGAFWQLLLEEYERTCRKLLDLSGQADLLAGNPNSRQSIRLREDIVKPLIVVQQYALQNLQRGQLSPQLAETLRKIVLRAMFGIINAARNAA